MRRSEGRNDEESHSLQDKASSGFAVGEGTVGLIDDVARRNVAVKRAVSLQKDGAE